MILSLRLEYFRKHVDLLVTFTGGLNVLRGPNEIGKTTITEGILYALYGSKALVDSLSEVVTWGHKENKLSAELVLQISGVTYTFTRSKAGAECNYALEGMPVKVTGQAEVTAFAAKLLGADGKTAAVLMMASQAGLRGALDEGASAVSALIGKLADFDMIDRLLDTAGRTLSLGAEKPIQDKLLAAQSSLETAAAALADLSDTSNLDENIATHNAQIEITQKRADEMQSSMVAANEQLADALQKVSSRQTATDAVAALEKRAVAEQGLLQAAQAAAAKKPDAQRIAALRQQVHNAATHEVLLKMHQAFLSLPAYPEEFWDEPKNTFDDARQMSRTALQELQRNDAADHATLKALRAQIITSSKCPTCGAASMTDEHVKAHNDGIQQKINAVADALHERSAEINQHVKDLAAFDSIEKVANARALQVNKMLAYVDLDESHYPPRVTWRGEAPQPMPAGAAKMELAELEAAERAAIQAEGQITAHTNALTGIQASLEGALAALATIPVVDVDPFRQAYDSAFAAYSAQTSALRDLQAALTDLQRLKVEAERVRDNAISQKARAELAVEDLKKDLDTLQFNNELVKKLKTIKPLITDHLWNSVLAAVSNFFSVLRGEQSVVTKDAEGFKVNGRGGSLSGSTLDMLALAIRVALSKTFVPHASFMVLDEPAHGCDTTRTGNVLGFLASVGFDQTILASHDELSEAVADNVINLGD